MLEHKLCVPCLFGLEGPLGNELRHMGLRSVMPENGRVRCTGTDADIARMNLRCRFGERVLLELGSFPAPTFDALFEGVKALPWAQYLPADAAFPVKGYSLESVLHSVPDCQKIIKKAVVESLKQRYHVTWFAETGALYQIQFSLVHDTAIDPRAVAMARDNARRAGVDDCITFAVADAREFDRTTDRGVIVTNPPYGERLMEKREAEALYTAFGAAYAKTEHWRLYLLSSHTEFERAFGRPADKKRKLYNGTLRCDLFQYTKDV